MVDLRLTKPCSSFIMSGQPVADLPFQGFGTGREERNGTVIFGKSAIATFANGDVEKLFPQDRKMVFFEVIMDNGETDELMNFKQKEDWKTVLTRAIKLDDLLVRFLDIPLWT